MLTRAVQCCLRLAPNGDRKFAKRQGADSDSRDLVLTGGAAKGDRMKYLFVLFVAFSLGADAKPCASVPVSGPIAQRYRALGASDGPLGCPIGNETEADRGGRGQMFETGMIVTSPSLGALATLAAYQQGAEIVVEWGPVEGVVYTLFQVHWDLNGQGARQQDVGNPTRTGGRLSISAAVPGQYRVTVQGCSEVRPAAPVSCKGWTSDAVVDVRAAAAQSQSVDPRFARRGMPNRPAETLSQPPAAQPPAQQAPQPAAQADSRFAPPPSPVAPPPSPNSPSIPRPSYSEPGATPGSTPNTNNPAQGYLGPRNNSTQTAPSEAPARSEFARSSVTEKEALGGSAPAQGTTPASPPPNPNQKFAVYPTRACTAPMPTGVYLQEYMRLGGPNGPMGCPIQAAVSIPGVANGGRAAFQNGSIVTNNGVWPNGVLAAFQQGGSLTVDWAVSVGDFSPGFHYDKFVVRWYNAADANSAPQQVDVAAQFRQPDWGDTHLRSQGTYSVPWGGSSALLQVSVEGCDNPSYNLLKPDPGQSRCLQGWMPNATVMYMADFSLLPHDDFASIDFKRMGAHSATSVEDSIDQLRTRGAAAILQSACSLLSYSLYNSGEGYTNTIMAKMLYADYFESDKCPGRNINNRDEVNASLRVQSLWGDENAGSTFDGIQPPKVLGDICGPQFNGDQSECPPFRKGEYDVMLSGFAALLSKYGSALAPDVYHHVLYDLLNKKGPLNPSDLRINIGGVTGSETENHILQIVTGQYLTNQLMFAETHDSRYNNAAKGGMNAFVADFMHSLLTRDFLEYNARPYQDYAITAIQNLYSFALDAQDAPANGISSHSVKLAAEMVLDYISAKVAISNDDGRRSAPYRRKAKYDNLAYRADAHDLLGGLGDAQYPRMLFLAGVGLDQIADPSHGLIQGTSNYGFQMVHAAFSSYRLPELILDEMVTRADRHSFAMFHHAGDEVYFRSSSYMLSAGGHPAPTLYPYSADPNTISLLSAAVVADVGGPIAGALAGALAPMITSGIQIGDDDARGVAVPTTLVPAGLVRSRDSLLRFEGPAGQNSTNMCVAPAFACGQSLQIPNSYLANHACFATRPGATAGSRWIFLDVSAECSPMHPLGFFVAIWTKDGHGFFEVYERPGEPGVSNVITQKVREQAAAPGVGNLGIQKERELPAAPGASTRPSGFERKAAEPYKAGAGNVAAAEASQAGAGNAAVETSTGNLTFPEFINAVWQRNGTKQFSTGGNTGANSYQTLDGSQIAFQIGPDSLILNPSPTSLVSGTFMNSDIPGRITIRNDRTGQQLVLDDSRAAAPVRTITAGLPSLQFQNKARIMQ